jgi:hypothetical protein
VLAAAGPARATPPVVAPPPSESTNGQPGQNGPDQTNESNGFQLGLLRCSYLLGDM